MSKFRKNKQSGFTLVEALLAVSIFTISMVVLMSVLADGISDTNYAKKKTTAAFLAQEGVEVVRNLRDTYILYNSGTGWSSFQTKLVNANSPEACLDRNGSDQ